MTNFLCFVIALHVVSFANLYVIKNLKYISFKHLGTSDTEGATQRAQKIVSTLNQNRVEST